jgi:hypothetical protein
MRFSDEIVATLCAALEKEPLFHISLGSKELFHSNFLAWFADYFPEQAAAVFHPWTDPMPRAQAGLSEREAGHLDLILHLPGLAPIAVENKVFSVPDEEQLDRYAESFLAQHEAGGTRYARVLLSLMSPGWTIYNHWRRLSYRELAEALRPHVGHIRAADAFAGDLVEHYIVLISRLVELLELLGTPTWDEPLLLTDTIAGYLEQARISAGVQKARASCMARELRSAVAEKGWSGIRLSYGFTNGMSLLEGFCRQGMGGSDPAGDELGWQLQGTQFRLAVITNRFLGPAHREEREAYVAERYSGWFDFTPLEAVPGVTGETRANEVRGGRWNFQGYNPDFVYRYRTAPQLTPSQIVEIGLLYLDRAREILITNRGPATQNVDDELGGVSEA